MPQTTYSDDKQVVYTLRVSQPVLDTMGLFTTPPPSISTPGQTVSDIRPKISKTSREFGLRPRFITITRVVVFGVAPNNRAVTFRAKIPIATLTGMLDPEVQIGQLITHNGLLWVVQSRTAEDY